MTRESHQTSADRLDQQQRQAQTVETVLERLHVEKFEVERIDQHHYKVAGIFHFWPATGLWRTLDGKEQGYQLGTLIKRAKEAAGSAAR